MVSKKDNKYGDMDELLGSADTASTAPAPRRKKPLSPALGAITGVTKPTRMLDEITAKKDALERQLLEERARNEKEKSELIHELDDIKSKALTGKPGAPIVLTMPVTKQDVTFDLRSIDPALIDVSEENERIQDFLDEISLRDILPSIKKHGQQKPGTVRPKSDGRYELIEGSRRLAAVKLTGHKYLAFNGDVPDADVRDLSVIENKHRDVSPYEKAKAYQRQLESGEYSSWQQLGVAKGISDSHINRHKKAAEMDELFIKILASPSDMTLAYADNVQRLVALGDWQKNKLFEEASRIYTLREQALEEGGEPLDADSIFKALKSAVRVKSNGPTKKKPVSYSSRDGSVALKHSIAGNGNTKLELSGVDQEKLEIVLEFLKKTLKVG